MKKQANVSCQFAKWLFAVMVMASIALGLASPRPCDASAVARCSSSAWSTRPAAGLDTDWARYTQIANALAAKINWTSGDYSADAATWAAVTTSESKFNANAQGIPIGRTWAGFDDTHPLPLVVGNSRVNGNGAGSSVVNHDWWWPYRATWTVGTGGLKGATVANPYYAGYVKGADPWPLSATDMPNSSTMDIYVPLILSGGSSAGTGSDYASRFGYDVSYATASGSPLNLLHIEISGNQVIDVSSPSAPSNLHLYLMPDANGPATTLGAYEISINGLKNMLQQDIGNDSSLDTPINLAVFVGDLPIPTVSFGDGSVALVDVSTFAYDQNVPEPSTLAMLLIGGLAAFGRRKRKMVVIPSRPATISCIVTARHSSTRFGKCLAFLISAALLVTFVAPAQAGWRWWNIAGTGRATVDINAKRFSKFGFLASARMPGPFPPAWPNGAAAPAGANPNTWSEARLVAAWPGGWGNCNAVGGDTCGPEELLPYVTPVSYEAYTAINIELSQVSSTQALFTGQWMGTDQGTAQRLRWYKYTGTVPSSEDFQGDYSDLPAWNTMSELLREELRSGPWNESISITVNGTGLTSDNILLVSDGLATSVPEPATLLLAVLGCSLALLKRRR